MKHTKILAAIAGTVLAFSLLSCNEKKSSAASSTTGEHAKVTIKFPTAGASGALYAVGAAITNLWDTQIDFVNASSQASNGGIDNLNQIADGESQVSIAISSNCYQSFNGTDSFKGNANKNLRVIAGLYFNPNQVVAT
ncbi:MAG: C4-dicarboxylate ABC transporter substrate-binding protein, partial [Treponema sp.]|nr:C4-dicarboxylate ABC transporter substrate-binding protein [Treponema sp.]